MPPEGSQGPDWGTSCLKANVRALLSRDELTPTRGSCHVSTRCWIMASAAKYKKHTWDKEVNSSFSGLAIVLKITWLRVCSTQHCTPSKDQCKAGRGSFHNTPVWDRCSSPARFFPCPWAPQENHWWLQNFLKVMDRQPDYIFHMEQKNPPGYLGIIFFL